MLVQNPPMPPLSREELDRVYALPYTREYHPDYEAEGGVPAITEVKRVSKPGLRKFVSVPEIPAVLDGMGLAILSTSKGVMSGAAAKKARLGGEIICTVA